MRIRHHVFTIAVVAMLGAPVVAPGAVAPYAERVRETVLPNGLKVLLLEDHRAPVATFQVWYRVGSRNEELGKTGLAHLLEHMMFKGTKTVGAEQYSRIIQRNGGNENAFTTDDNTAYFATLASDRLGVVVDLEADRMHNLSFDEAQFKPEHQVVIEERRLRTDNDPVSALFELLSATAYMAHPYQWPTVGWMTDLKKATREDALAFYQTYYEPNNAFVVAVGDFNADELLGKITAAFGQVPTGGLAPAVRAREPEQQGERRTVLRREAELPFVALAYHVPNLSSDDAAALTVLAGLLGNGKSSRLYRELVYRQRIARVADTSYSPTSVDPGLFLMYAQPMPGKSAASVEKALLAEVDRLRRTPVAERELLKVKNGLEADFIFAQDSLFYQAMLLGQYEMAGGWRHIDEAVPKMRTVTAADVQRVADLYLTSLNRTVATLDPIPTTSSQPGPAVAPPRALVH
jgi:zinc protease